MTATLDSLPATDGFRMPAEWEPHAGTWMIWPERPDNWREGAVPAQAAFTAVASAIARFEPLSMLVSAAQWQNARRLLPSHIRLIEAASDDSWCRDSGPTFVTDAKGRLRGVDWEFNAWGGLYSPFDHDRLIAAKVLETERAPRYAPPLVLEGGSIHVDGEGTLLTTEECLLNSNRNPDLTREEIEQHLRDHLGITRTIWLGAGLVDDETSGHIDNIACFVKPGVVALTWCDDPADPQYAISRDAFDRLSKARDARGRSIEVVKLPLPGPLFRTEEEAIESVSDLASGGSMTRQLGERLGGSYVNFYVGNGFVLMPALDAAHDEEAAAILRRLFPGREVVALPTREILLGGGNIHCITQQQPVGTPG
ncbi:agmatine deiminase [Ancylobacter defluvii]|uniref:Putative agmatine deiminase n=1 Tax=Ancylobacter defluvii TaxID=1282440 RepID=A0A9W6JZX4_9HYPH|nr:agmatine deiminase [Ancylobacter defluvii]MBS7587135.1 agmatine deiminase [Ancylobacter defluvii]GLK85439.1 agmatine deiminase [Ancylobacter defluvii]